MEKSELISVKDYAEKLGKSTQYIYRLLDKGKLTQVEKDGKKYIEISENAEAEITQQERQRKQYLQQINQPIDNQMVEWLKEEVERLNKRIETLEGQLFEAKSESLEKVIDIQEKKDAQLQSYIEYLTNSTQQLIAQAVKKEEPSTHHQAEIIEEETEAEIIEASDPIQLNSHLKELKYKKDYRKKIIEKARKAMLKDSERFKILDNKIYIYPNEFKYSDIF